MPVNDTTRKLALEARVNAEDKRLERELHLARLNSARASQYDDARQEMRRQVEASLQAIRAYEQGPTPEPRVRRRVSA